MWMRVGRFKRRKLRTPEVVAIRKKETIRATTTGKSCLRKSEQSKVKPKEQSKEQLKEPALICLCDGDNRPHIDVLELAGNPIGDK
ncbi:hypothetical protein L2E82_49762 [Cichorium intybus]|uniref:Uncharacterized protein n=1 Tax=Cichorium intybus TaxID=13427 RepID=A0ACB8Z1E1_CICIN|nr:hypothetical protein L2E82_49762 [Cichorium intybus]